MFEKEKIMVIEHDITKNQFKYVMKNIRTIYNDIHAKIRNAIIAYYSMSNNLRKPSKINKTNSMEYYEKVNDNLKHKMVENLIKNTMQRGYYIIEPTVMRMTQEMNKIANMEYRNIMNAINKEKSKILNNYRKFKRSTEANRIKLGKISTAQNKSLKELKNKLDEYI